MKSAVFIVVGTLGLCAWLGACGDPGYELDGGADTIEHRDAGQTKDVGATTHGGSGGKASSDKGGSGGASGSAGGKQPAQGGSPAAHGGSGGAAAHGGSAAPSGSGGHASNAGTGGANAAQGLGDPTACAPCETHVPHDSTCFGARAMCLSATGTAAHGPKAGAPLAELCSELISCIWRTGCGSGTASSGDQANWTNCFCGKGVDCLVAGAPPTGVCKDEFLAAFETTDIGQINNRFYDVTFASGLAVQTADCDSLFCPYECGICAPAAGPGTAADDTCHPSSDTDGGV